MAKKSAQTSVTFQKITTSNSQSIKLWLLGSDWWAPMPDLQSFGYGRLKGNWSGSTTNTVAYGDTGGNRFDGSTANDIVEAGGGNDTISGNDGNDWLYGEAGDDSIDGGNGNDVLVGGSGNDTLDGGSGDDYIYGDFSEAYSQTAAGQGNDSLIGGNGKDKIWGGGGNDTIWGDKLNDNSASGGDDSLFGGDGDDTIYGGGGNDWIDGDGTYYNGTASVRASGNDLIDGGFGNDTIHGGAGKDTMTGGDGNDVFVFMKADSTPVNNVTPTDTITDFEFGKDLLWFDYNPGGVTVANPLTVTATEKQSKTGVTMNFAYGKNDAAVIYNVYLQYNSGKLGHDNLFDSNNKLKTTEVSKLFITFDGAGKL